MVNVDEWDADDRNEDKDNDLGRYLDALTRQQQQLVKGIKAREAGRYLRMKEEDFKNQLKDSLTHQELSKLDGNEQRLRDRLIDDIMAVWRRQKQDIEAFQKDWKRRQEFNMNKSAEGWTPKHHDRPLDGEDLRNQKLTVSQAARLHEEKNVTVRGILSGVQPLRKMIKGVTVKCLKCGKAWWKGYDKPELTPSLFRINQIRICLECKSSKYLESPTYDKINAVVAEPKDENTFSEIDPIKIVVFGDDEPAFDNTLDIERHLGEPIEVSGDIYSIDTSKTKYDSRVVVFLYVKHLVNYLLKQDIEITGQDVKGIQRFVRLVGSDKVVSKLTDMFATSVIGHTAVKTGLLLCATSTSLDKGVMKLNTILVGDVGLAKSELLKNGVKIVPGSRYENIQFATGKSLTAIVDRDEGGAITLRTGPIPQAKGAIAALNEIGMMQYEDQGYLYDIMQEQEFTTNKHGRWFHIDAPTAIIASGNPIGGSWRSERDDTVSVDKIPTVKPLLDRFPLIFIFKDDRSEKGLAEYASKKSEMQTRPTPDYTVYLQKHILYVKQRYPKPKLSPEAISMLNQYYVGVRSKGYGSPRIMNTITRIAETIASLKLKNEIDEDDARETMTFYNVIIQQLDMVVALPSSPRDVAYQECLNILMESTFSFSFEELIKTTCERNQQVAEYIGNKFTLEHNKKLRPIVEMLRNHSRVEWTGKRPIIFHYRTEPKGDLMANADSQQALADHSDHSDPIFDTPTQNENEKNNELQKKIFTTTWGVGETRSERSERSDSPYSHLIRTEDMPSTGKTAYSCIEHPDKWDTSLDGLEISHFKPFHTIIGIATKEETTTTNEVF